MAEAGEVLQDASEITVAGVKYLWSMPAGRGIYTDRNNRRLCKSSRRADSSERKAVRNDNLKFIRNFMPGIPLRRVMTLSLRQQRVKNQIFANEDSTEVTSSGIRSRV